MRSGAVSKTDAVCILVLHIKRGVGKAHFVHGISKVSRYLANIRPI